MKITQKSRPYKTSFDFGPDQVEYLCTNKNNTHGGSVFYQNIPRLWRAQLRKVWAGKYLALSVAFFGIVMGTDLITNIEVHPPAAQQQDLMVAVGFMLACLAMAVIIYFLSKIGRPKPLTIIRCQPDLCIIQDDQHDRITDEIRKRRLEALRRKFAFNDPLATPLVEARKFRWLRANEVISESEFAGFMAQLTAHDLPTEAPVEKKTLH